MIGREKVNGSGRVQVVSLMARSPDQDYVGAMTKRVIASSARGFARDTLASPVQRPMSPWEAGVLEEANREIAAGLVLRDEDLDDYLDGLTLDGPNQPPAVVLRPLRR